MFSVQDLIMDFSVKQYQSRLSLIRDSQQKHQPPSDVRWLLMVLFCRALAVGLLLFCRALAVAAVAARCLLLQRVGCCCCCRALAAAAVAAVPAVAVANHCR